MPGVRARILYYRTPLEVTYQLQDTAETERDAIVEDPYGLGAEDVRVPARGLLEIGRASCRERVFVGV